MQQELAVPLGAQDRRLDELNVRAPQFLHRLGYSGDRHLLRQRIAHDAAFADLLAAGLKLRLHQHHQFATSRRRARRYTAQHGWENECSRDEGNIHGDKADRLRVRRIRPDLLGRKVASVGFLQQLDSRVAAQSRINLPVTGVHGDDFGRATLQEAVGEAAG